MSKRRGRQVRRSLWLIAIYLVGLTAVDVALVMDQRYRNTQPTKERIITKTEANDSCVYQGSFQWECERPDHTKYRRTDH